MSLSINFQIYTKIVICDFVAGPRTCCAGAKETPTSLASHQLFADDRAWKWTINKKQGEKAAKPFPGSVNTTGSDSYTVGSHQRLPRCLMQLQTTNYDKTCFVLQLQILAEAVENQGLEQILLRAEKVQHYTLFTGDGLPMLDCHEWKCYSSQKIASITTVHLMDWRKLWTLDRNESWPRCV